MHHLACRCRDRCSRSARCPHLRCHPELRVKRLRTTTCGLPLAATVSERPVAICRVNANRSSRLALQRPRQRSRSLACLRQCLWIWGGPCDRLPLKTLRGSWEGLPLGIRTTRPASMCSRLLYHVSALRERCWRPRCGTLQSSSSSWPISSRVCRQHPTACAVRTIASGSVSLLGPMCRPSPVSHGTAAWMRLTAPQPTQPGRRLVELHQLLPESALRSQA